MKIPSYLLQIRGLWIKTSMAHSDDNDVSSIASIISNSNSNVTTVSSTSNTTITALSTTSVTSLFIDDSLMDSSNLSSLHYSHK